MFFKMLAFKISFLLILINSIFWEYSQADTKTKNNRNAVTVSKSCKTTYQEILKHKKHRFVIFYIKNEKQIDVEAIGARDENYDQFLIKLQAGGRKECRYGVYDIEYHCKSSKKQNLFLIAWCSGTATIKKKRLYGKSYGALKKTLVGLQKYIFAFWPWELTEKAVVEKLCSTTFNK